MITLGTADLRTRFGVWQETLFYDGQKESIAMTFGEVKDQDSVLCRMITNKQQFSV